MFKTQGILTAAPLNKSSKHVPLGNDNLLTLIESSIGPAAHVISLLGLIYYFEGQVLPIYLILSLIVFALVFPSKVRLQSSGLTMLFDITLNWIWVACLLLFTGFATSYIREFSIPALTTWLWVAPLTEVGASFWLRRVAPALLKMQGPPQRALIVGLNKQGLALATRIRQTPYARISLTGFVDNRSAQRVDNNSQNNVLGTLSQLTSLIQTHHIQIIYLSLPMVSQPRILQLLDELKDTTASIYFVPDMFVTDLIQGHAGTVCGMPVISVCETPFKSVNGVVKRISDIVFSLFILSMIFPLMLVIAAAVRFESPGPIIFKQRRYGLDGEEILVYKFRSMTVTEDGSNIQQAQLNDARITRLGAFLRKSSLDELPQFINVLQGHMSVVGPRPHAIAHNELYRKLIKGYMVRHKVKPGITGWAQVNGYRGETKTLDKMQGRIDYDLDYLRNWSLRLDAYIIFKTIHLVLKDQNAY
ncbi:MAG: undecaprenyl-phosphate glucose phosphotransferase [Rhodoferax sp.]|uniref:undecaprenyl-phosphate glucose phosphotransferase n=1 Tax=Rhodoferax sp. TaxID=50421 RepID=UPI003019287E